MITAGLGGRAPSCWRSAAGTACAWSARTASASRCRAIGLNATFAATQPRPGSRAWSCSPAASGSRCSSICRRLGIGVSSFASVGDKYDVSSNDLLTWWEQDEQTRLAVLYVESFGNPRAFARTARRVGRKMPVLTIIAGRSAAGQRAARRTRPPPRRRWSPRKRSSARRASSPRTAWASWSRPRRCCRASRCRPAAGSRSCPTRAAPACWPRTRARTRPAGRHPPQPRPAAAGRACCRRARRSRARSTPRPRSAPARSGPAWRTWPRDASVDALRRDRRADRAGRPDRPPLPAQGRKPMAVALLDQAETFGALLPVARRRPTARPGARRSFPRTRTRRARCGRSGMRRGTAPGATASGAGCRSWPGSTAGGARMLVSAFLAAAPGRRLAARGRTPRTCSPLPDPDDRDPVVASSAEAVAAAAASSAGRSC